MLGRQRCGPVGWSDMKHLIVMLFAVVAVAAPAAAQVVPLPTPPSLTTIRLAWDSQLAIVAGVPETMVYRVYDVLTPTPPGVSSLTSSIVTATCVPIAAAVPVVPATVPPTFTCTSSPLTLAKGNHSLTVTAENAFGESTKSTAVTTGAPGAPRNPRVVITVLVDIP